MQRKNFYLPDRQILDLQRVSLQAQLPVSEVLRRVIDHSLCPQQLCYILPHVSGQQLLSGSH
jgi:hypothetical protein